MALLYILRDHLPQPSVSWRKVPQQIEPSSSCLFSGLPFLVQKPQPVQPLSQRFQADPECSHAVLVFPQKFHDVLHGVHHLAQIFENVHDAFSQIWICVSWMTNVLTYLSW